MIRNCTYLLLFVFFVISCNDEEDNNLQTNNEAKIKAFKIIRNSKSGIQTTTELDLTNFNEDKIDFFGVKWYKKSGEVHEKKMENLVDDFFDVSITEKILKDSTYNTYSYIQYKGNIINSDTLEFKSNFTTPIIIDSIYPNNGFIFDTLNIRGKNFCTEDFKNSVYMNNGGYSPIYESDSLIKVIIPTYLSNSELNLAIKTCGISKTIDEKFKINSPKLDSIEKGDKYVGDKLKIYGKNLHHSISELWLDNIKTSLEDTEYKDTLVAIIPKGLSIGKVDLKLKVLDKIIEKPNYFQTTTPFITEVTPSKVGFFDVIKIKGKYFKQGTGVLPKITIGDKEQSLVNFDHDFINVFINRYFYAEKPELKIEISNFKDVISVDVRSPKILEFDKEKYHFEDDLIIKTDAFIEDSNLKIGGKSIEYRGKFEIDSKGEVKVSLLDWLNIDSYAYDYIVKDGGKLQIDLKNNYGADSKDIQMYPPQIISMDKKVYLPEDYMTIKGEDLAYSAFNKIFIDGELVEDPHNSSYTVKNDEIRFELTKNTSPGKHTIYVEVAGQKSNTLEYEIGEVKVNSISKTKGTRRDTYTLLGENLNRLDVYANDELCDIVRSSDNKIEFKFPYYIKLEASVKVTGVLGDQKIDIVDFKGTESHDIFNESLSEVTYYGRHVAGSDSENWYHINNDGVFKFNHAIKKWQIFDTGKVPFNTPLFGEKLYLTVNDTELILPLGNKIYSFNLSSKTWTIREVNISVKNGVIVNNMLYAINYEDTQFYEYNLTSNVYTKMNKPSNFYFSFESVTYGGNKVFFNPAQGETFYYDINTKSFVGMGRPRNLLGSYQNVSLKYYNSKLYFIGGLTDAGKEHRVYEYDFNLRNWREKTPMLMKGYNFSTHVKDGVFYMGLGNSKYGYTNSELNVYNFSEDIH